MHLQGKTIWLTGASSGIGEALAQALAAHGARLILTARREALLVDVRNRCANAESHIVLPFDLADVERLDELVQTAIAKAGHIDVLINNAGIGQRATVLETTMTVGRQIMEINYFSIVALTRALLPHLLTRPEAMVVGIASLMGKFATPRRSAYCASKHALIGFMDALRAEMHDTVVKVLVVCPGWIRTPFSVSALKGDGQQQGSMDNAQKKGIPAETCAAAIIKAMHQNKAEIIVGGKERHGAWLKRFFPGLLRKLVTKVPIT